MQHNYRDLGPFSDWVAEAQRQQQLFPLAVPGAATQQCVRDVLGFCDGPELPLDVRIERTWQRDGIAGEMLSWSVGYGPRSEAWLLKPADAHEALPGVLALHDHGGFKFYGKEKIADGPDEPPPVLLSYRDAYYGGRAYVEALAREGFAVLVHDTFLWGSRRFPLDSMPQQLRDLVAATRAVWAGSAGDMPLEVAEYNQAAQHHEEVIAKYANLLGTNLAGVVSHEDRIALNYLRSRPEVAAEQIGCIGLSGGGNRAALLQATHDGVKAAVIVGLMSTYAELLDHNITHTWMLYPSGWARYGDWPDLASCRAPSPLLVQYDLEDALFTERGMRDAHARIAGHYATAGHPEAYSGQFYPGPHKFDRSMQQAAFAWLRRQLRPGA